MLPGVTLFDDPEGDDNPPLPTADNGSGDLLSLHVSEPTAEPNKLVFTLRLRSLAAQRRIDYALARTSDTFWPLFDRVGGDLVA